MASLLNSESRRLYSWWWDSHISPKNSKWLQENLKDMDDKVKAMIKLIEEDADSFARRAEMYYEKRPELMKLVEEFYRAYRALAERYDHATGELRHAQRTIAASFPNQVPFDPSEDSASITSDHCTEPRTPESLHPFRALLDSDELHKQLCGLSVSRNGSSSGDSESGISLKGLKQLHEMFGALAEGKVNKGQSQEIDEKEESSQNNLKELSNENKNLKAEVLNESERAGKAETEVQTLKKSLGDMHGEKEAIHLQYLQSLQKLSCLEGELSSALKDSTRLHEQTNEAEAEVHTLKEALAALEAEKDAGFSKETEYLKKIANLEGLVLHAQEEVKGTGNRAFEAESETQYLRNKVSRLESEKEVGLVQYKQCLNKISDTERKISAAKEDAKMLHERAAAAEIEVEKLKRSLSELNDEKEALSLLYERCLEKISKLESDLSFAQEEVKRLNDEILTGATKLKQAEEVSVRLEMSNQCLRKEADNLAKKIALKDQELSHKHDELEKLQTCVHDEHSRYVEVEASLQSFQSLHSQSQEEQRILAMELKDVLQMLKDLEACKNGLEEEMQQVKDENRSLNELNSSSTASMNTLENEIIRLRNMKRKLEEEVDLQLGQSTILQQEICMLKEEITELNRSYRDLMKQVEGVGLDPESFVSSVKDLQDENFILRQNGEKDRDEKDALLTKLDSLKLLLEKNGELEGSQEKGKELPYSCQLLNGEKSTLVLEKSLLLSQLHIITENIQKLMEKNNALESSLTGANVELEGLRSKSKCLEDLCQLLKNEKSNLVAERSNLVIQLEIVEDGLAYLEKRFSEVEEKYAGLEKEKESTHSQVHELKVSLIAEKQEREKFSSWNDTRLADVENHIRLLQEDNKWRKKEFQDELDKAVIAQFDVYVLQKFMEDMEERNYSLLVECEKHIEASKLAEKLISELESENLEQQVEEELLLVEIEKLRLGIYQVFKALDFGADSGSEDHNENEQIFVNDLVENIENMKSSLLEYEDEKQQLLVENSVILTLLEQLKLKGQDIELEKNNLYRLYEITKEQLLMVQNEKSEIVDLNRQLRSDVREGDERANILKREVESLYEKQSDLQRAFLELQKEYSRAVEENKSLLKNFNDIKKVKCLVEEENDLILLEALSLDNLAIMYRNFDTEKAEKLKSLNEDMQELHEVKNGREKEIIVLKEKLAMVEAENVGLKSSFGRLTKELLEVKDCNDQLKKELSNEKGLLYQKSNELSEAEEKIKLMENMNSDLCIAMEDLKWECEESMAERENLEKLNVELHEDNVIQRKEIECLHDLNGKLESELDMLYEEIEDHRIREDLLSSELQQRENDFELWEAEATTFYFDLQLSNIREVLFEDKVHELTGVRKNLEDETTSKTLEVEQMKESVSIMESEIKGLKGQLNKFTPVIASLKETISSLEHNSLSLVKLVVAGNQTSKDADVAIHLSQTSNPHTENVDSPNPDGISDLEKLQTRILAVEKVVVDELNTLAKQKSSSNKEYVEAGMIEIEELNSKCSPSKAKERKLIDNEILVKDHLRSIKTKPELSEARKGNLMMKDIQLDQVSDGSISGKSKRGNIRVDDQMLELWQAAEDDRRLCQTISKSKRHQYTPKVHDIEKIAGPSSVDQIVKELGIDNSITVFNQGGSKRARILQRLTSDAQKLANLQTSIQEMMKKLQMNKRSKKKGVDFETVMEQLKEVKESTVELVKLNGQLIEKSQTWSPSSGDEEALGIQTNGVSDEARKGSEKIGRLQLEVQKIHFVLLKLDDEKKGKGKSRFSRTKSRTSVILKDFIYSGKRGSSGRRKKGCLRGCFRPSSPANIGETSRSNCM